MGIFNSKLQQKCKLKKHIISLAIIAIGIILYNYIWDIITSAKIYSFGASVFDLGVFYQSLWITLHDPLKVFISNLKNAPINFLLSPLSLDDNMFFFVHLQTLWLSLTAVPLYFISIKKLNSRFLGILISLSFLVFFGLAGVNWFDVHRQSLFIPLFISGYALLIYNKNRGAIILLVLSGLVRFPYIIFPLIFGLSYIIENFYYKNFNFKSNKVYYYIFFISLIFFIIGIVHIGSAGSLISEAHGNTNYFNNFKSSLDNKIFTVFLFLAPFFMLPALSKRWLLLMLQFFFLSFFSGYPDYIFPNGQFYQYYSAIIPFLYLGFIDVLSNLKFNDGQIKENIFKIKKYVSIRYKIVMAMFIIIIMLALFYEPYGPFNEYTGADFDLKGTLNYNITEYNDLNRVVALIPKNDPYILYQNSIPEVDFRDPVAQSSYTSYFPDNHTFYINNQWTKNINYIIIDPDPWFWFTCGGNNNSIYSTFNHYILSGNYKIKAEYNNVVLLQKNYTGSPVIYKPDNYINTYASPIIIKNNTGNTFLANYASLQPGNYTLKLTVSTNNISEHNYINLNITYLYEFNHKGWIKPTLFNITSQKIGIKNRFENITFNLKVPIEMAGVNLYINQYNGTNYFEIRSVRVTQNNYLN